MELVRRLELDLDPSAVAVAREFVVRCCIEWGQREAVDPSRLVVSELVSNALKHACGPVTVVVARRLDRVVVSVEDGSQELVDPYPHDVLSEGGRGLELVAQVAAEWGAQPLEHGKRVWAEVVPDP